MSSHKEAPGIINDAAADNTDVYAFVSPDKPNTVTLIANYVPFQNPAGGPNFYEFGDDVRYEINVDNTGDGRPDITYRFEFTTEIRNENTFLYNTGPITSLDSANWNRRQFVTVSKVIGGAATVQLARNLACPPSNVGPRSTPNYGALASAAIHTLNTGEVVFAGQRAEGFYVDLGAIFDLGILRPLLPDFLEKMPAAPGVNATAALNIASIAIQVPKSDLLPPTADGTTEQNTNNTIGVWATASRQKSVHYNTDGTKTLTGPYVQLSRLGNPLINEVVNPISEKDDWNSDSPSGDSKYEKNVTHPMLAGLLNVLYPGAFPNLAKYKKARNDLVAILLNGLPAGVLTPLTPAGASTATKNAIKNFQNQVNGHTAIADMLRLNTAVKPASTPSNLGILGLDLAGYPNGRRVFDDVTTIELRAIAGAALPLVDSSFKPDAAVGAITEGLTSSNTDVSAKNTVHYLDHFPYLGTPHSGFYTPNNDDPAPDLGAINQPPGSSRLPVGAPNTGGGLAGGSDRTVEFVGAGVALAGVAGIAGVAARRRPEPVAEAAPAAESHSRPRPRPTPGGRANNPS